jgi:copper transport protein
MRLAFRRGCGIVATVLVVLAAAFVPTAALAHATLTGSEPAERVVVARPPAALKLTFNEPVSPLTLRLVGPDGETTDLTDIAATGNTLVAALPGTLARGTHLVSWRVISLDGHPVGGALTFSIGAPSIAPGSAADSALAGRPPVDAERPLRIAIWLARLVLYIGLFCGVGGAFYAAWIAGGPLAPRAHRFVAVALECGLVAAVVSVGLQGVDVLGLRLPDLRQPRVWMAGLAISYGWTAIVALMSLAAGQIALDTQAKAKKARRLAALALAGLGIALAGSGHAAAAAPQILTRPAVLVHAVAVAFWIGALLPLAFAMRAAEPRGAELLRFSRAIPFAFVVLAASGGALAVIQIRQIDALWTTDYGLVLCAKLVAVAALIALAAVNRYALTPRVVAGDPIAQRRLVRSIATELAVVAVLLGLVASWRFTPPPRSLIAAAEQAVHLHIHGEKAMADLTIELAGPSGRRIAVNVLDGQFGPLSAKEVTLFFAKPDAGIEPLRLPATQVEGAAWRVDRVQLPLSGVWQVRVDILVSDFEKITLEDTIEFRR